MEETEIEELQQEAAKMEKAELIWALIEAHDDREDDEETERFGVLFEALEERMK